MISEKISVIVPFFNCIPEELDRCLCSLKNQSYLNIQVILVDDASDDIRCKKTAQYFCDNDSRFLYFSYPENKGVSYARNYGIERADGQYIVFVDADDWVAKNIFLKCLSTLSRGETDTVIFNATVVDKKTGRKRPYSGEKEYEYQYEDKVNLIEQLVTTKDLNSVWQCMYSKKIIDQHELRFPLGVKSGEDFLFNSMYFVYSNAGRKIKDSLYFYCFYLGQKEHYVSLEIIKDLHLGFVRRLELTEHFAPNVTNATVWKTQINDMYMHAIYVLFSRYLTVHSTCKDCKAELLKSLNEKWIKNLINEKTYNKNVCFEKILLKYHLFFIISTNRKIINYIKNKRRHLYAYRNRNIL